VQSVPITTRVVGYNPAYESAANRLYGMLTLPVHHDLIQVFMESVLFIYVFFLSSCVALPILCPSTISCFRCSSSRDEPVV
jgi:hypothetical protein